MKGKIAGYVIFFFIITAFAIREIGKYGVITLPTWLWWIASLDRILLFFSGHPHSDVYAFVNYMGIFTGLLGIGLMRRPRAPPRIDTTDLNGIDEDVRPQHIEEPKQAFEEMREDHGKLSPRENLLKCYEQEGANN